MKTKSTKEEAFVPSEKVIVKLFKKRQKLLNIIEKKKADVDAINKKIAECGDWMKAQAKA